ncbi:MAG: DUF1624 domain-containing protein [Flavobacteriia bacterium]|nr:DUF1624 domain-containing protein [Flavobacteriia bacterium]
MRNQHIDSMRSLAIIIMLTANTTPYLISSDVPFVFRAICSFAAPLFTFLSGYTFALIGDRSNGYVSGFYVLISAMLVDVIAWGIPPFQTFDVLYVIALGQVILALIKRLPSWALLLIALILMSLPTVLQTVYRFGIADPNWNSLSIKLYRWAFDGWFPVFPWLSFPIMGYLSWQWKNRMNPNTWTSVLSVLLFIGGFAFVYLDKNDQPFREGYVEIFYPATLAYLLVAYGFCYLLLFGLSKPLSMTSKVLEGINLLGRHSMFVYIFHAVLIAQILASQTIKGSLLTTLLILLLFYSIVYSVTFALETLLGRKKLNVVPKWIRKPLGLY